MLFRPSVNLHQGNYLMSLSTSTLGMDESLNYKNETNATLYEETIHFESMEYWGAPFQTTDTEYRSKFKTGLTTAIMKFEERIEEHFGLDDHHKMEEMTLEKLQSNSKVIDWSAFFKGLLKYYKVYYVVQEVFIFEPSYLELLDKIIQSTPPAVLDLYAYRSIIYNYAEHLDMDSRKNVQKINDIVHNVPPKSWERQVKRFMTNTFESIFYRWYAAIELITSKRVQAEKITETITKASFQLLQGTDWVNATIAAEALEGIGKMKRIIRYPLRVANFSELLEVYKLLKTDPKNHFENILSANRNVNAVEFRKLMLYTYPE